MTSGFQQMLKPPFRRFSSLAQVDHQPLQQRHSAVDIWVRNLELLQQPFTANKKIGVTGQPKRYLVRVERFARLRSLRHRRSPRIS